MNVPYNKINTADAARIIGVEYATVANWCKKKLINCEDISNGTEKSRYLISEAEVDYLKDLKKQHGTRKILLYYNKDWAAQNSKPQEEPTVYFSEWVQTNGAAKQDDAASKAFPPYKKKIDAENITNTILYIQDIKERLEDLEAEKAQLLNELEELRKEIMEQI